MCHEHSNVGVEVKDADFRWTHDVEKEKHPRLVNVTLNVAANELVTVIGPVASGKSTLLYAILGETNRVRGSVALGGKIAYVPQTAFLINATIRYTTSHHRPPSISSERMVFVLSIVTSVCLTVAVVIIYYLGNHLMQRNMPAS
jgi:ABC-type multidrug transport system fused ATPase/permease subunit